MSRPENPQDAEGRRDHRGKGVEFARDTDDGSIRPDLNKVIG